MKTATTKIEYPDVDAETLTQLRAFKKSHGPQWKNKLNLMWMMASAPGVLHRLRNTHGPSWLVDYKLP